MENAVASAIASTVPGMAHGTDTSVSIRPRRVARRCTTSRPAHSAMAIAPTVATVAIQSELTSGRSRSGSDRSVP